MAFLVPLNAISKFFVLLVGPLLEFSEHMDWVVVVEQVHEEVLVDRVAKHILFGFVVELRLQVEKNVVLANEILFPKEVSQMSPFKLHLVVLVVAVSHANFTGT